MGMLTVDIKKSDLEKFMRLLRYSGIFKRVYVLEESIDVEILVAGDVHFSDYYVKRLIKWVFMLSFSSSYRVDVVCNGSNCYSIFIVKEVL